MKLHKINIYIKNVNVNLKITSKKEKKKERIIPFSWNIVERVKV